MRLTNISGLVDTLNEFANSHKKPFLEIVLRLQMFADIGYRKRTKGLGGYQAMYQK
jgi:imidazoleglycerol phosphate synthase glutamine amidotransferase subunit HisH